MTTQHLAAEAAHAIQVLRTALGDCLAVMERELEGLKVIQPELAGARAALDATAAIGEFAAQQSQELQLLGDDAYLEVPPSTIGASPRPPTNANVQASQPAGLAGTIPWEMGEHRVYTRWALTNYPEFASMPALTQAWKQGQGYERARAARYHALNELAASPTSGGSSGDLAPHLADAISILADLKPWVRSERHITRIDALFQLVGTPS